MLDPPDEDPRRSPTLTELEEARSGVRVALHWLMASEDAPDVEVLLE
jgi:hypothetical protein